MKISAIALALIATVMTITVHADDQDFNSGLKQELNQDQSTEPIYPKRPKGDAVVVQTQTVQPPVVTAAPAVTAPAPAQIQVQGTANVQPATAQVQPIYILQQPQSAPTAQVQPPTTVEAQAVRESKADQLRKEREDLERQTEDKLMQRLEDDRVLSEKSRADRIMSQPLAQPETPAPAPAPALTVQQQLPPPVVTPVVVQPAPVAIPEDPGTNTVATKVDVPPADNTDQTKFTVGGLAGLGAYPSVSNVSGTYSLGAAVGIEFPGRLGVELAGVFSQYRVTNSNPCQFPYCVAGGNLIMQLNQANVSAGLTYKILDARVSPVIGVLGDYTRRNYSNLVTYGFTPSTQSSGSNALDGGLLIGVDIMATNKLSIGADFRYFMNVSYTTDNALAYYGPILGSPLETLNYYIASINLKLSL